MCCLGLRQYTGIRGQGEDVEQEEVVPHSDSRPEQAVALPLSADRTPQIDALQCPGAHAWYQLVLEMGYYAWHMSGLPQYQIIIGQEGV